MRMPSASATAGYITILRCVRYPQRLCAYPTLRLLARQPQYAPFWILVIIGRKLILAATSLFFVRNPGFQMSVVLLVMFISYTVHVSDTGVAEPVVKLTYSFSDPHPSLYEYEREADDYSRL